mmetsp:Transcript_17425/g.39093  ORF Transcript_17425/g.39093 Transcript_17425/m.39093 type:complete len:226 (+) Transcript_17425:2043-2720(+)
MCSFWMPSIVPMIKRSSEAIARQSGKPGESNGAMCDAYFRLTFEYSSLPLLEWITVGRSEQANTLCWLFEEKGTSETGWVPSETVLRSESTSAFSLPGGAAPSTKESTWPSPRATSRCGLLSNEAKRSDLGMISPPRFSLCSWRRSGRASRRTERSVHIPAAAIGGRALGGASSVSMASGLEPAAGLNSATHATSWSIVAVEVSTHWPPSTLSRWSCRPADASNT